MQLLQPYINEIISIYRDELITYFEYESIPEGFDINDEDTFDDLVDELIEQYANSERYEYLWIGLDWRRMDGITMGHVLRYVVENQKDRFDIDADIELYTNQSKIKCLFNYLYITDNLDIIKHILKDSFILHNSCDE